MFSKSTIKTPERPQWLRSGVFIVSFEHFSQPFLVFLLVGFRQVNVSWVERPLFEAFFQLHDPLNEQLTIAVKKP